MARAFHVLGAVLIGAPCMGCGPRTHELPPLGEVVVVVDTDLPVPKLAGRLRVDLYGEDGTWYESRDVARPDLKDWPASFSLYSPDPQHGRASLVRLRVYPEGKTRDYRGERFAARPVDADPMAPAPAPDATDLPRLIRVDAAGATTDATPISEPQPQVTVDRLLLVRVSPGTRGVLRVVLRGTCVGTMADIAARTTCTDTEDVRVPLGEEVLQPYAPSGSFAGTTVAGTFENAAGCSEATRSDEEVCVPGGAFIFGSPEFAATGVASSVPERVVVMPPFIADRYEVTVARWRAAVAAGFRTPDYSPVDNPAPLPTTQVGEFDETVCTWSRKPVGRETYPVNCITWIAARAFCRFIGGDLPTEAQWEYMAAAQGRPFRTRYPWGNSEGLPPCTRATYGRYLDRLEPDCDVCIDLGYGPRPVDEVAKADGDVSVGLGIVNLAGGMSEWSLDAAASLGSNCWAAAPLTAPSCNFPSAKRRATRGGSWRQAAESLYPPFRLASHDQDSIAQNVGFRCVRPGEAP